MRHRVLVPLALLAACGGGSAAPQVDGPPAVSIVAGNNQVVSAAPSVPLPSQVVAQVVRLPNGQVSMRILDALLPEQAYAQGTAVNGIPGAVVCAVAPDPKHQLTPEVPCTNTDLTGKAYFTYHADTVAGVAKSQVRGTVNGVTQVSDSVQATVMPAVAYDFNTGSPRCACSTTSINVRAGDTVDLRGAFVANAVDKYHNLLTSYTIRYLRHNLVCPVPLVNGSCQPGYDNSGSDARFVTGDKMVVRAGDRTFDLTVETVVKQGFQFQYVP